MTSPIPIDVYLIKPISSTAPNAGRTIFVFDAPEKLPDGVSVDRAGNITFCANAPDMVTFIYTLRTPDMSWANGGHTVTFKPNAGQKDTDMFWVVEGKTKPSADVAVKGFAGFVPTASSPSGAASTMSITMNRTDANLETYSYGLAVNMAGSTGQITVRDDPQIKNPPRNISIDWFVPAAVALILGFMLKVGFDYLVNRRIAQNGLPGK